LQIVILSGLFQRSFRELGHVRRLILFALAPKIIKIQILFYLLLFFLYWLFSYLSYSRDEILLSWRVFLFGWLPLYRIWFFRICLLSYFLVGRLSFEIRFFYGFLVSRFVLWLDDLTGDVVKLFLRTLRNWLWHVSDSSIVLLFPGAVL